MLANRYLFFFIIFAQISFGQNTKTNECGTPASKVDFLKTIPENLLKAPLVGPKMLKIFVHICRNDDGSNQAMTIDQIEPEIEFTNTVFGNNAQICFAVVGYDYINSTTINTDSYAQLGGLFASYNEPGAFDVFIVASIPGGIFGFAPSTPAEYMATKVDGFGTRRTFIHEMGHALGLEHTFRGYPSDANGCRELVNGSNSTTCGDFLSDTPADPDGLAGATATGCTYNGTAVDANNELFNPITTNYMSYWANAGCNRSTFTAAQANRMQTIIENNTTLTSFLAPTTVSTSFASYNSGKVKVAAKTSIQLAPTGPVTLTGTVQAQYTSPRTTLKSGFKAAPSSGGKVRISPSTCTF